MVLSCSENGEEKQVKNVGGGADRLERMEKEDEDRRRAAQLKLF